MLVASSDTIEGPEGLKTAAAADLRHLAQKYVWWSPPERVMRDGLRRLVASVMEFGTWDDAHRLLAILGREPFDAVLDAPPAGVVSDRSLAFWHFRLRREGPPPKATRRFPETHPPQQKA